MNSSKRIDGLDLLKVVAIIMVISQHVPLYDYDFINNGKVFEYLFKLLSEGVPLFLTINGFLLFNKQELDINKHYYKTLRIFILICVWEIILIILGMKFDKTSFNLGLVLDLFFRTGGNNAVYTSHLWFMQQLIAIYCVYPLLWKTYKEDYSLFKIMFILLGCFSVGVGLIDLIKSLLTYEGYATMLGYIGVYISRFSFVQGCSWSFLYFCLGGVIAKNIDVIKDKRVYFILLGFMSWLFAFAYGYTLSINNGATFNGFFNANTIFMVFMVIGWFAFIINYRGKGIISKFINKIGENTFGIYILHTQIFRYIELLVPANNFISRFVIVLLTLVICYLITIFIKKIPFVKKLVSFTN